MKQSNVRNFSIIAHIDHGKSTLADRILELTGAIDQREMQAQLLDNMDLERERGITIFSKQALLELGDTLITLIDTPGHIDFSCEAERAISVQDYAILIISATDGVTAHTKTLWHLLAARSVPTFIFVNKTDISDRRRHQLLDELRVNLSSRCVDFTEDFTTDFFEACASADERLMEQFFATDTVQTEDIRHSVSKRRIFPCFLALRLRCVELASCSRE